jgi:hypothetical protein
MARRVCPLALLCLVFLAIPIAPSLQTVPGATEPMFIQASPDPLHAENDRPSALHLRLLEEQETASVEEGDAVGARMIWPLLHTVPGATLPVDTKRHQLGTEYSRGLRLTHRNKLAASAD